MPTTTMPTIPPMTPPRIASDFAVAAAEAAAAKPT